MGSDWQNPYLPSLVNAAFTLMLKKTKLPFFLIIPLLKSFGEISRLGWRGTDWPVGR